VPAQGRDKGDLFWELFNPWVFTQGKAQAKQKEK